MITHVAPSEARYYTMVIVGRTLFDDRVATGNPWAILTETDYFDAFTAEPIDPADLVPRGWELLETDHENTELDR